MLLAGGPRRREYDAMPKLVTPITDTMFAATVLEADRPVVVDFTAAWCAPCRPLSPLLEQLAEERPDVCFVQVDVDTEKEAAARWGVLSMPTLMVFRGGQPVLQLVGARPRRRLIADLAVAIGEVVAA